MKKLFIAFLFTGMIACNSADQTSEGAGTGKTDQPAASDAVSETEIQWLDSTYIDLGKIKEGQVVEVSYRFKNVGTKNLVISSVTASCGCTVPEKPEKPFAPGEEGVIKAKFDSKGRPAGENRKTVTVESNTPSKSQQLNFRVEIAE